MRFGLGNVRRGEGRLRPRMTIYGLVQTPFSFTQTQAVSRRLCGLSRLSLNSL